MAKGECNCGAVKFELTTELQDVYICHCSICRKSTGSSGIAVVVVDNSSFHWLKGREYIRTWTKPGHDWQTSFCQHCGSPLPGTDDDKTMYIPCSLLTSGDENLRVAHHIWVDSKANWDEIGDSGQQHQQAFQASSSVKG